MWYWQCHTKIFAFLEVCTAILEQQRKPTFYFSCSIYMQFYHRFEKKIIYSILSYWNRYQNVMSGLSYRSSGVHQAIVNINMYLISPCLFMFLMLITKQRWIIKFLRVLSMDLMFNHRSKWTESKTFYGSILVPGSFFHAPNLISQIFRKCLIEMKIQFIANHLWRFLWRFFIFMKLFMKVFHIYEGFYVHVTCN